MLPSADATFNYAALSTEKASSARAAAERIIAHKGLIGESAVAIGRELKEQKTSLGHGNYLTWVKSECSIGYDLAARLVRIYEGIGDKVCSLQTLSISALDTLASADEPVRTEVIDRAANGEKVTAKEIDALKRKLSASEEKIAEKEAQRAAQESLARIAERQVNDATNRAMFAEADKERLADELAALHEELERATEPGVITVVPTHLPQGPRATDSDDGVKRKFLAMATQFVGFWNKAPEEWRNEFLLGKYFPEDLAEALNAA